LFNLLFNLSFYIFGFDRHGVGSTRLLFQYVKLK
jgi:hypothetical protein